MKRGERLRDHFSWINRGSIAALLVAIAAGTFIFATWTAAPTPVRTRCDLLYAQARTASDTINIDQSLYGGSRDLRVGRCGDARQQDSAIAAGSPPLPRPPASNASKVGATIGLLSIALALVVGIRSITKRRHAQASNSGESAEPFRRSGHFYG